MINLQSVYHKPDILKKPGVFDSLVRGIATQPAGKLDTYFDKDVSKAFNNILKILLLFSSPFIHVQFIFGGKIIKSYYNQKLFMQKVFKTVY